MERQGKTRPSEERVQAALQILWEIADRLESEDRQQKQKAG